MSIDLTSPLPITGKVLSLFGSNLYDAAIDQNNQLVLYHVSVSPCGLFLRSEAALVEKITKNYTFYFDKFMIEVDRCKIIREANSLHTPDVKGALFHWPITFFECDRLWEPPVLFEFEENNYE